MAAPTYSQLEAACRQALRRNPDDPQLMCELGMILAKSGRLAEAVKPLEQALRRKPDLVPAAIVLGNVQEGLGNLEEALKRYGQAVAIQPDHRLFFNLGNVCRRLGREEDALSHYSQAYGGAPSDPRILSALVSRKQLLCDWDGLEELGRRLFEKVASGEAAIDPFRLLALSGDEKLHYLNACRWGKKHPIKERRAHPGPRERLTIGYLSADLHQHATAYLAAGVFESHDRGRFKTIAYSTGQDDGSPMRRRLEAAFDTFRHLPGVAAEVIARQMTEDGIDILVDLKGNTRNSRMDVLALRPAPVQVSWLGYPGTLGVPLADYILADALVLPLEQQQYYAERIIHLPHCYQPNDRQRPRPASPPRAELGLPEDALVLNCFNATYKITPALFAVWMRLLAADDKAVLWLLTDLPSVTQRLHAEAERHGIASERIIFAPHLPQDQHLARYGAADLFLDTLPYGAHTTGSDALWMGCPVVTCRGTSFAGRVGSSLLAAVGLPELVADDLAQYQALALDLMRDPGRRTRLRQHLEDARETAPLFDTIGFTRALEAIYEQVWVKG